MAASLLSGAAFGASLIAAGIYQPAIIVAQLRFEEWHMVQVFMTAAAGSSIVYALFSKLNIVQFPARAPSPLGFFPYDGNFAGGALLGAGMALSGACPGSVLPQAITGIRSGIPTLVGSIACGILWSGVAGPALQRWRSTLPPEKIGEGPCQQQQQQQQQQHAVHDALGTSRDVAVSSFVAISAAAVAGTLALAPGPQRHLLPSVGGGIAITLAQLFSLVARREMLGMSAAFEDFGKMVLGARTGWGRILFAVGTMGGAVALVRMAPEAAVVAGPPMGIEIGTGAAVIGGGLVVLGSRLAGGCPSGHGLSGIALMSVSSFVTVAALFVGGGLTARIAY